MHARAVPQPEQERPRRACGLSPCPLLSSAPLPLPRAPPGARPSQSHPPATGPHRHRIHWFGSVFMSCASRHGSGAHSRALVGASRTHTVFPFSARWRRALQRRRPGRRRRWWGGGRWVSSSSIPPLGGLVHARTGVTQGSTHTHHTHKPSLPCTTPCGVFRVRRSWAGGAVCLVQPAPRLSRSAHIVCFSWPRKTHHGGLGGTHARTPACWLEPCATHDGPLPQRGGGGDVAAVAYAGNQLTLPCASSGAIPGSASRHSVPSRFPSVTHSLGPTRAPRLLAAAAAAAANTLNCLPISHAQPDRQARTRTNGSAQASPFHCLQLSPPHAPRAIARTMHYASPWTCIQDAWTWACMQQGNKGVSWRALDVKTRTEA